MSRAKVTAAVNAIRSDDVAPPSYAELAALVRSQAAIIEELRAEVTELRGKLNTWGRDSHNSSQPPSTDNPFRKPAPAPKLGGGKRKVGGQHGHAGATLLRKDPDTVVRHELPARCLCGSSLEPTLNSVRQVFDLPPTKMQVSEHRTFKAICRCGRIHRSEFPVTVKAPTQYGPNLQAMAIYLTQHHMLPIARTAQILGALTGEPIAPSTVQNTIAGAAAMLVPAVELIKNAVGSSPVVHADETGLRVAGGLHWMHVAVTEELTFAGSHPKRGIEGIAHFGVLDQVQGTIVHDGFGPYKDLTCLHGLCNAHHLRELQFEAETTGQLWSFDLIKVLLEANAEVRKTHSPLPAYQLEQLQRRYRTLLDEGERLNPPRDPAGGRRGRIKQSTATCLLRRLRHLEEDVLRFAVDPDVPFTNNLAERSIRMPKVKQKISGCFRTAAGAQAFCTIRSYLATLAKQKRDLLGSLILALQGNTPNPCFG